MRNLLQKLLLGCLGLAATAAATATAEKSPPRARPLFRDFVGVCGHTVQFKPDLYWPVARQVRDYHPVEWDLPKDTSLMPEWPFARNRVSWEQVYGSWAKRGYTTCVCLNIDEVEKKVQWKDMEKDSFTYARQFAENFGPGGNWPYVPTVEIGNEPGLIDDATYLRLYKAMASGIRAGNPKLKIATCNVEPGKSDRYWKGVDVIRPALDLVDILRIHRYAIAEGWPVWRRSYPEDSKTPFLSTIQELLHWRDKNAADKLVYVSEFGWDSSTKKPDPKGEWAKWIGSTDEEQAMYLVRSFFLLAEMGVDKAFVYFFNDEDTPSLHAASGLTRNFEPKPAYHAVAWMLGHLQDYRFSQALLKDPEAGYAFLLEPENGTKRPILAVWQANKPQGTKMTISLPAALQGQKPARAEKMPLDNQKPSSIDFSWDSGKLTVPSGPHPVLVFFD